MTGRHAQPTPPPTPPRHAWALRPIAVAAGILIAAGTGAGWHSTWAPTVQPIAVALSTAERSDDTGARAARGFPTLVRPTIVPTDVTPWSEDDGPVTFYGQALPTRTEVRRGPPPAAPTPAPQRDPGVGPPPSLPDPQPEPTQAGQTIGLPDVVVIVTPEPEPVDTEPEPDPEPAPAEPPAEPTVTEQPIDDAVQP